MNVEGVKDLANRIRGEVGCRRIRGVEHLRVRPGNYNAIKMDLNLQRVNKKNELEPHRKFKRATIWLSDDNDRVILRIESQIFVGTVTAELQSIRFDND